MTRFYIKQDNIIVQVTSIMTMTIKKKKKKKELWHNLFETLVNSKVTGMLFQLKQLDSVNDRCK